MLFPQVEILFYFHKQIISDGREDIIFFKKKVKHPDKITLYKKLKKFFDEEVINHIADNLYKFCGTHQKFCIITVALFFATFLGLVIIKDFYEETDLSFAFDILGHHINIGSEHKDNAIKLATFLVDFATLPLVVITLLFSAHGDFKDSKHDNHVDNEFNEIINILYQNKNSVNEIKDLITLIKYSQLELQGGQDIKDDKFDDVKAEK